MDWKFWKNQNVEKKVNKGILKDIFSGNIFQDKQFYKQIPFLVTIILMMFFYIDNRYVCERQLEEISELEKQLIDKEYQYLTISSLLIRSSQQSEVYEKVKKSNLNLNPLTSPAVEVKK